MVKHFLEKYIENIGYTVSKIPKEQSVIEKEIIERGKSIIERISPKYSVLNGPMKGLKYPSLDITEAALVPKIVGSYESQLHPIFNSIFETPYTDIIEVGSAEGYYAIGMALQMPNTTIHCFDINERDLNFSKEMASHNNVANLTYNSLCTPETLINFNFKGKGLIFCDCEGYELELFTEDVIERLKQVDVLVELHDIANPAISSTILSRFQDTHDFLVVNNLNIDHSQWNGLEELSEEDKSFAVFEHRGGLNQNIFMEWAFLTAKSN